jgi:hypothetical protein
VALLLINIKENTATAAIKIVLMKPRAWTPFNIKIKAIPQAKQARRSAK